jgi:hypothetical protein
MRRFQFDAHPIEAEFWILGRRSEEIDPQVTCLEPGQCEGFEVPGCIEYSGVSPPPMPRRRKAGQARCAVPLALAGMSFGG